MKLAESWLREWTNPSLSTEELAHQLTMAGHEVDAISTEGSDIEGVVVAEIVTVNPHPNADKLRLCEVNDGNDSLLEVVCGAPNVYAGMKVALASVGARLPNGIKLKRSKIRGVVSNGMLCSAIELGLGDESDGILELAPSAPVGEDFTTYLQLPDSVIDVDLTANRGDCFSVLGLAREVGAFTGAGVKSASVDPYQADIKDEHPISLIEPIACPRFVGRIIRNINPAATTPVWMVERLRRAGLRAIYPVVDITNYVMLELGQPLHAYDLGKLRGTIGPRFAEAGEKLTLLDDREVELSPETLIIVDDSGPIGMAGIMGGLSTAVADDSTDIFLEAAFFAPDAIVGRARTYGLHTDASLRFERGVDPSGQARAIERATELLVSIAGGVAGPTSDVVDSSYMPVREPVCLRKQRLAKVLGADIPDADVTRILECLEVTIEVEDDEGWVLVSPSHRFDLAIEEDFIEEVARIYGYDRIPEITATVQMPLTDVSERHVNLDTVANVLVARGYQEVIGYSFIDGSLNERFTGARGELELSNPISSEMSVMRGSLWPGMVTIAAANMARQQERVRIFELGKSFHGTLDAPQEVPRVACLTAGSVAPEQWGLQSTAADLFDIKSDLSALLAMAGVNAEFDFAPTDHPALQPGQAAKVLRGQEEVGLIGRLHPRLARQMGIASPTMLFELDTEKAFAANVPASAPISKYPAVRRDIAVLVANHVTAAELVNAVAGVAPDLIQEVRVFDLYRGKGIEPGLKSIALGLILQETSRTLTDQDADAVMRIAIEKLRQDFAAELRE